ncbi:anhydro-N-acetylmuramic acid kinase [Kiloniella majae]|uniref:anhydro-N-acetylmuramic acid kinase n=1 Tax=Kiloniella majae TaxID=1938558 RepID=UPI000A2790B2|nr:anhydro-N-acetylmuramic acid kinase [Kiloniella majae]
MGADKWLLGLMSGTSMDGIDAALIKSDGHRVTETGATLSYSYTLEQRSLLQNVMGEGKNVRDVEEQMTRWHHEAVTVLLDKANLAPTDVELIGFHGQTTFHDPSRRITIQIGDGDLLASLCGIPVVNDFRKADVAAGGEGAPFAPLYHQALAQDLEKPLVVLNVGGVSNITYLDPDGTVLACDTGPGNGLIDDWVQKHFGQSMDEGGAIAAKGEVNATALDAMLDNRFLDQAPPKSLDRYDFTMDAVQSLNPEDGAATLTAFTAAVNAKVVSFLPKIAERWVVTGGGRHNPVLMEELRSALGVTVDPVESVGWDGDALEAQAFAFLAKRSQLQLPLSLPTTTKVPEPCLGGVLHAA